MTYFMEGAICQNFRSKVTVHRSRVFHNIFESRSWERSHVVRAIDSGAGQISNQTVERAMNYVR